MLVNMPRALTDVNAMHGIERASRRQPPATHDLDTLAPMTMIERQGGGGGGGGAVPLQRISNSSEG